MQALSMPLMARMELLAALPLLRADALLWWLPAADVLRAIC
jgi:hypothetical protein